MLAVSLPGYNFWM